MIGDELVAEVEVKTEIVPEWPEKDVEELKALAKQKELSARQIGERMGRTRNMIIGKLRRLGIPLPQARTAPRQPRRQVVRRYPMDRKKPTSETPERRKSPSLRPYRWDHPSDDPIVSVNGGKGITILELGYDKCHTVVGSTRPRKGLPRYCGQPAWNSTAYCEDHYAVFHQPPRPR